MRTALLIGTVVCSAAMGDEVISTLGADWSIEVGWKKVGQTMTVPTSSVLESFTFVLQGCCSDTGSYIFSVYEWDEVGQHTVGSPYYYEFAVLPDVGGPQELTHEIGVALPEGAKVAVVVNLIVENEFEVGFGWAGNEYAEGSLIATYGSVDQVWNIKENYDLDMAFEAVFSGCGADMNGDGELSILDFVAFQSAFTAGSPDADCTGDGVLNVLDFVCFQDAFLAGCGA